MLSKFTTFAALLCLLATAFAAPIDNEASVEMRPVAARADAHLDYIYTQGDGPKKQYVRVQLFSRAQADY